jgi:CRISPR-associated endoribonuclease Cas6
MPDLASIVFTLTAARDTTLPLNPERILQASFLKWLGDVHPNITARLHDANEHRPYTVSGVQGEIGRAAGKLTLRKGATVWYRVTGMEENFIDCVLDAAQQIGHGPQPGDLSLQPGPALHTPEQHPAACLSSFAGLAAGIQKQSESGELPYAVSLHFSSPTCFMQNKQSLPLPIPAYVIGYLTNQWQLASPFPLPVEEVQHFVESIHLAQARIETRLVDLKKYQRTGFVGHARFALHPALPENYRQALNLLAKLSFYSGVGSHTTMGMGQCEEWVR